MPFTCDVWPSWGSQGQKSLHMCEVTPRWEVLQTQPLLQRLGCRGLQSRVRKGFSSLQVRRLAALSEKCLPLVERELGVRSEDI